MIGSMYVFTSVFFDQRWEKLLERDLSHTYGKLYVRAGLDFGNAQSNLIFNIRIWLLDNVSYRKSKWETEWSQKWLQPPPQKVCDQHLYYQMETFR